MNIGMEMQQRQQLTMTPQLQQALRLLQLSSIEFNQELETALSNNPFLEEAEPESANGPVVATQAMVGDESEKHEDWQVDGSPQEEQRELQVAAEEELHMERSPDEMSAEWSGSTGHADAKNSDQDWTEWSEATLTLQENLRQQLLLWPLGERERILAHLLIEELSDAGYLETGLEELLALMPQDLGITLHELEHALRIVQELEPAGIGARTLQECLQLQLKELDAQTPGLPIAETIVAQHFDLLAKRQFPRLEQLLSCDETALHSARALIRTLDPRPGRCYAGDDARYIVPDIMVLQKGKQWEAKMNPAVQPSIRLNQAYADLAKRRGTASACSQMLQEARWLLRNIAQRFDTIQRVASAIVKRQKVFFSYGEAGMKPLSLKDIAGEVGLHESTVCRVTNGKYMATPRGLYEFKYFFSRQLNTNDGGNCSTMAIRALIKELITAENPAKPLSDVQLAKLLGEQGFRLVRRTVTKYRTQLRIPSVELRRVNHAVTS